MRTRIRTRTTVAAAAAAAAVAAFVLPATAEGVTAYRVTITNLTTGQPLTPPLVALHSDAARVFDVGAAASDGVKEVAENGNLQPLLDALNANAEVDAAEVAGAGPLVPAGNPGAANFDDHVSIVIPAGDATQLSFVSMLICTNDGFTGLDSLTLPTEPGAITTRLVRGYDAGTEMNTEDFADIVPPCQGLIGVTGAAGTGMSNPALAEGGVIVHHPGIEGGADLVPQIHGWTDPVARVDVQALSGDRTSSRLAGPTRIETAVEISQASFPNGAEVVYLANAWSPIDAVAGGSLTDGPVLLVDQCNVPSVVEDEVERLSPGQVVALGGPVAICDDVLAQLTS